MRQVQKRKEANQSSEKQNGPNANTNDVKIILSPQNSTVKRPEKQDLEENESLRDQVIYLNSQEWQGEVKIKDGIVRSQIINNMFLVRILNYVLVVKSLWMTLGGKSYMKRFIQENNSSLLREMNNRGEIAG